MTRLGKPLVVLAALFALASACSTTTPLQGSVTTDQERAVSIGVEVSGAAAAADKTGHPATLRFDSDDSVVPETDRGASVVFDVPGSWPRRPIDPPRTPAPEGTLPDYQDLFLPTRAFVATVIGDGVGTQAQPSEGPTQHWFPNPTQFGGDRVFLVLDQTTSPDFVKISLPIKPNGQEGWIARHQVIISEVEYRAVVDLTNHALTVWRDDEIVVQTKVVTGKPATPTPVGQFFVRDIITRSNPGGAYGPYILALSGFSEVLETFGGGLPAIAIHGTNNPGLIGQQRSNGCIRIPNDLVSKLAASVPLGTPVTVIA